MTTPGDPCDRHETEINRLREKTHELSSALAVMSDRVPISLGETIGRMDEKIDALKTSVGDIITALKHGYATTAELAPLQETASSLGEIYLPRKEFEAEFGTLKRLFWAVVTAVILGFVGIVIEVVKLGTVKP